MVRAKIPSRQEATSLWKKHCLSSGLQLNPAEHREIMGLPVDSIPENRLLRLWAEVARRLGVTRFELAEYRTSWGGTIPQWMHADFRLEHEHLLRNLRAVESWRQQTTVEEERIRAVERAEAERAAPKAEELKRASERAEAARQRRRKRTDPILKEVRRLLPNRYRLTPLSEFEAAEVRQFIRDDLHYQALHLLAQARMALLAGDECWMLGRKKSGERFRQRLLSHDDLWPHICETLVRMNEIESLAQMCRDGRRLKLTTTQKVIALGALLKGEDAGAIKLMGSRVKRSEPKHPLVEKAARRTEQLEAGLTRDKLDGMTGHDFEQFVERALSKRSWSVVRTKGSGDFGADLILEASDGTRVVFQTKRWMAKVNLKAVQEVVAARAHYQADLGIVIAPKGFYKSAAELAKSNEIELWDASALARALTNDFSFSDLERM